MSNTTERKRYDKNRKRYKLDGELDALELFGEKFSDNAWGDNLDGSDISSDKKDENNDEKPDQFRLDIYNETTSFVNKFLSDIKDKLNKEEFHRLNKRIKKQNKKEKLADEEAFFINTRILRVISIETGHAISILEENANDQNALKKLWTLEK